MTHIPGKYELTENKNFYEQLIKIGLPEEQAKAAHETKSTLEFEVTGNKIRLISDALLQKIVSDLVVNSEVEETFPGGIVAKSTTKLDGNVITVESTTSDSTGKRVYTFSASGVEVLLVITKGDVTVESTRIFKRV